jgi:hypothetical protein
MKYTKYFGAITKDQGQINLSSEQFRRMMNIVHVEGALRGMNKIKETHKNKQEYYKYDMLIFNEKDKLKILTSDLSPELLLTEMLHLSEE